MYYRELADSSSLLKFGIYHAARVATCCHVLPYSSNPIATHCHEWSTFTKINTFCPMTDLAISPSTWLSRDVRRLPSPTPTPPVPRLVDQSSPSHLAQLKTPIMRKPTPPTASPLLWYPQLCFELTASTNQSAVKATPPATI